MTNPQPARLRLALQKSGRLTERSHDLLTRCGLTFNFSKDKLFSESENFPLDLMLVRDDDIPEYVSDGICELGIVGLNVVEEYQQQKKITANPIKVLKKLGFGNCRLSIAVPVGRPYDGPESLKHFRIATSYPGTLRAYLARLGIDAQVVELSGSVEIAPKLQVADAICDLVSTGATLRSNGLREVETIFQSECALVQTGQTGQTGREMTKEKSDIIASLTRRIEGVIKASQSKYIMMNAPRSALPAIRKILPGMEAPTVISLGENGDKIAIHSVSQENIFWDTMEKLKLEGASSILVVPIEKIID